MSEKQIQRAMLGWQRMAAIYHFGAMDKVQLMAWFDLIFNEEVKEGKNGNQNHQKDSRISENCVGVSSLAHRAFNR